MGFDQSVPCGTSDFSNILNTVLNGGSYHNFLHLIEITTGHELDYILDISHALLLHCKTVSLPFDAIDICGTGGDAAPIKTTNISTISAFVLASMGVPVAKHGGRAVSSSSGSTDFLDALGIPDANPIESIQKYGVCFLRAQNHHTAFKNIAPFRKQYGKKTIFNFIGPLINPASVSHQMTGVSFSGDGMEKYAEVLHKLGRKKVAVVQSGTGFDELLSFKENEVVCMENGEVCRENLDIAKFGFRPFNFEDLNDLIVGKTPEENAKNAIKFFEKPSKGALCDTIALNCGYASMVFGRVENLSHGVDLAYETIFSKKPLELLSKMSHHFSI